MLEKTLEELKELTKSDYKNALKENVCEVLFTKKNGTLRKLLCTLDTKFIPQKQQDIINEVMDTPKRTGSPDSIAVFDLETGAWRAFRIHSVLAFKIVKKTTP